MIFLVLSGPRYIWTVIKKYNDNKRLDIRNDFVCLSGPRYIWTVIKKYNDNKRLDIRNDFFGVVWTQVPTGSVQEIG